MLARLKPKPGEDKNKKNWLLFKERDLAASEEVDILETRPESVKSGRRIEQLVETPKAQAKPAKPAKLKPGALPGAVRAEKCRPASSRSSPSRRPTRRRRRAGCTRSSSTATAPWRMCRRTPCG